METYQLAQEWNDLSWGAAMPVAVMIGPNLVQVRAYGRCSFAVTDPARLEEQVPDPDNVTVYVKSLVMVTISDLIGERSCEVSDVAQLLVITSQTIETLQTNLESKFNTIGLRLKNVSIEKIESL